MGWKDGEVVKAGWQQGEPVGQQPGRVVSAPSGQARDPGGFDAVPKRQRVDAADLRVLTSGGARALADARARQAAMIEQNRKIENQGRAQRLQGNAPRNKWQRPQTPQEARDQYASESRIANTMALGFGDEGSALLSAAETGIRNAFGRGPGYSAKDAAAAQSVADRELQNQYAASRPGAARIDEIAGAVFSPLNVLGGGFIGGGATGAARVGRAGLVGGAQGAAYGAGTAPNGERTQNALLGAAVGFGTGTALEGAGNALLRPAARPAPSQSPQRVLSREGVDLTPGQMVGGLGKNVEDLAQRAPILGSAIRRARGRGAESFGRVAVNRSLAPIGEELPRNVRPGNDSIAYAQQRIANAYDQALSPVTVARDPAFDAGLDASRARLQGAAADDFDTIIADVVGQRLQGPVSGSVLKEADEEIGSAIRNAQTRGNPSDRALARSLQEVQDHLDDLLGRTSPEALAAKSAADEAYANFVRVQTAASSSGARRGVFTPAQLRAAARRADSTKRKARFARGDALMQDLAENGAEVLPDAFGNPGTADAAGYGALGTLAATNPGAGVPTAVGLAAAGAAYSGPVMRMINAVYRASDGASSRAALQRLANAAVRHPEARMAYNAVLADLRNQGGAGQQSPQSQPVPTP